MKNESLKKYWDELDNRVKYSVVGVIVLIFFFTTKSYSKKSSDERIFSNSSGKSFESARILGNRDSVFRDKDSFYRNNQKRVEEEQGSLRDKIKQLQEDLAKLNTPKQEVTLNESSAKLLEGNSQEVKKSSIEFDESSISEPREYEVSEYKVLKSKKKTLYKSIVKDMNNGRVSFPVKSVKKRIKIVGANIVAGSYVKGTVIGGAEAPEGKLIPFLIQLDEVYILPNNKYIDLSGCFIIAKGQSDFSSERVELQPHSIGCLNSKNEIFEHQISGWAIDQEDETFGVSGVLISKRGRVAATALGASFVSGISGAVQNQQASVTQNPLGGTSTVVNGDSLRHAGAAGLGSASNEIAKWYLDQAKNLLPTIKISTGKKVWLVMTKSFVVPQDFLFSMNGMLDEVKYDQPQKKLEVKRISLGGKREKLF